MHRTLAILAAITFALSAFSADAAVRCRNAQGQFITCPPPRPTTAATARPPHCTPPNKLCGMACVPPNKVCHKK
jgi:hypothetical protein